MGKRDKIKEWLSLPGGSRSARPSRSPSPQPTTSPHQPTPSPQPTRPIPDPATSTTASISTPPPLDEGNTALKEAFERHINNLPIGEKKAFLEAGKDRPAKDLLDGVRTLDAKHKRDSRIRTFVDPLSNVIRVLDLFMNGVGTACQANPDISCIVIGGVRIVLDIAIGFLSFFDKLSGMLCRFGDFMGPLAEYAKAAGSAAPIHEPLTRVYGDLLLFCVRAREIFIDSEGKERKWPSLTVFRKFQWEFDDKFRSIETDLHQHLDALQHAAAASTLGAVFSLSRNEKVRRDKELGVYYPHVELVGVSLTLFFRPGQRRFPELDLFCLVRGETSNRTQQETPWDGRMAHPDP